MLNGMVARTVSPVFVGREAELQVLVDAFERSRKSSATTVLLGGEAGVGKSRLIGRFAEQVGQEGAYVVAGGCVELSTEGLPYAPFTAALRQLVREMGAEEVSGLLPEGAGRDLARLLPEFGEPNTDMEHETAQARLFEQILALLERLAERRALVLVVEDIHWADRSSRDLIAFLSRNLHSAPVLMLLTYRSDDLHRQHPLRPVLAELSRADNTVRLDLPRLTREEVAAQIAGIIGRTPEYHLISTVYERSGGIPLFVEALVDADRGSSFPESLHDLIIGSVEKLPEESQSVLRMAAAGGIRIGHALLSAVSGLSDIQLERALRPAIAANVIQVADGHTYVFRHALIQEAVHDELLPGERARLHARFAEEIERDRTLVPPGRAAIEIAHHWYAARNDARALVSAWEAAAMAAKAFAHTEQLQLLERVLALWDQVPDAAERIGADHTTVLELASSAASASGEIERALKLVKAALAELDEKAEPERVTKLIIQLADCKKHRRKDGLLDDLRYAEQLVPQPGAVRAEVLIKLGSNLMFNGKIAEGTAYTLEALRIARDLGDEALEAELLLNLALGHSINGRLETTLVINDHAKAIGLRLGRPRLALRGLANNIDALNNLGRSDEAIELAHTGERLAKQYGFYRTQGVFIANNRAETLEALGRWDEALALVDSCLARGPALLTRHHLLRIRGDIAAGRGETEILESVLAEVGAFHRYPDQSIQDTVINTRLLISWHLLCGEPARALATAREAVTWPGYPGKAMLGWRLLAQIHEACDAAASSAPEEAAAVRDLADRVTEELHIDGPVAEAYRRMCVKDWDGAADHWRRLGRLHPLARSLVNGAADAARQGDRDGAAVRLREAHTIADSLAAKPMVDEVVSLARRVGVALGDAPANPGTDAAPAVPLTPRELEVLALVAEGRSNREIAEELFISVKTVSVHVSNILAKLGVSSRGAATAAARRLSLLPS